MMSLFAPARHLARSCIPRLSCARFASTFVKVVKEQNAAYTKKALKCYEESKDEVDRKLDPVTVFNNNPLVLFMEGTVDAPEGQLSLNVVKMLTEVQAVPLVTVDVTEHPAITGYTVAKSGSEVTPHLYYNGNFYGDHDRLLSKYKNGELRKIGSNKKSEGAFAGELPIGMY
ncbi:monothiol glutaredoxin-4, putative [Perkinsus marinus ATCC 50983]|uniref:Monothiol glutaredoxin-4, putative n=1 Tax=Perkinsus marinus (strain ATCC 50983 / TXsc) TaxID=423536 RepID=C5KWE2_PERM5|nr:monothiol glutaredoxin-4, putative [Perkinsus marinus ATCC 50983]EER11198.1 monothiol glutaredoxin-4, putative [Perkinsus marinus ATCC 50983]|eukprot:XP_002779403.1 monothiol glutaredoxin-4, putative [Perkinsus marinus ATCC 50983]